MDKRPEDKTASVIAKIYSISITIFIVVLQIIGIVFGPAIFGIFPNPSDVPVVSAIQLITCVACSGLLFLIIRLSVGAIYAFCWKWTHRDLYISGVWRHVHDSCKDDSYYRAGTVYIRQNYYNIEVIAQNYYPIVGSRMIKPKNNRITRWRYLLGGISDTGEITGLYQAANRFSERRLNGGIHRLFVVEYDEDGYPVVLSGEFADSAPSDSEGNITFFRSSIGFRKVRNEKKPNLSNGDEAGYKEPDAWVKEIKEHYSSNYSHKEEDIKVDLKQIVEIARQAGEIMVDANHDNEEVEEKNGPRNIVTKYDKEIQDLVFSELSGISSNIELIGEEGAGELLHNNKMFCILDPIDGTTNFSKRLKHSCVSIAVGWDGEVKYGCVYDPYLDDMFYAEKSGGAYLNGERIVRDNTVGLDSSLVCFGTCPYDLDLADGVFELAKRVFLRSLDLRRTGTSALEICYTAAGRLDLFFENILFPWDYAAASLILSEAGGAISCHDGSPVRLDARSSVVAGSATAVQDFYEIVKEVQGQ